VKICYVITGPPNGPVLSCWLAFVVFCRMSSSVVVCNAAGAWTVGAPAAGRVDGRAADNARQASRVTSR